MHYFILLLLFPLLSACEKQTVKTPAMLAFEAKQQQVQDIADKGWQLLTKAVYENPQAHLQEIALAHDHISRGERVYQKAGIQGVTNQDLEKLRQTLKSFDPALMAISIAHMYTLIDKTLAIRKRVEQIRSQPYSKQGIDMDPDTFIQRLSEDYNQDIGSCCLNDIQRIKAILEENPSSGAKELVNLATALPQTLHNIIKDAKNAAQFEEKLQELEKNIDDIPLTQNQ